MSSCSCIKLARGVRDVFGFNYPRQNLFVIQNNSQNPVDLCEDGHRAAPGSAWLIPKELYETTLLSSNKNVKVLAKFGAKQQLLKS